MLIVKLDLFDGLGSVEVAVGNSIAADRVRRFNIDAGDAFNDRDRWEKVRKLMTHGQSGPNVGWTLGIVLPGNDPDDAIDKVAQ